MVIIFREIFNYLLCFWVIFLECAIKKDYVESILFYCTKYCMRVPRILYQIFRKKVYCLLWTYNLSIVKEYDYSDSEKVQLHC